MVEGLLIALIPTISVITGYFTLRAFKEGYNLGKKEEKVEIKVEKPIFSENSDEEKEEIKVERTQQEIDLERYGFSNEIMDEWLNGKGGE